ncbi:MAG: hypothetical protein ACTHJQ_08025 [Rhizobiaceae bacterium]
MSEESMVERVARAARDAVRNSPERNVSFEEMSQLVARAAIEEMREPTKAMQAAIRPQTYTIEHYHGSGHRRTFPTLGSGPLGAWQDMIDAALKETA